MSNPNEQSALHRETWDGLPWHANGRLGERERRRADSHLQTCADCRTELAAQRQLYQIMSADRCVEQLPAAGLQRLRQRLAAHDRPMTTGDAVQAVRARPFTWQRVMAASVAVMAVALSVVAGVLISQAQRGASTSDYYTVTNPAPRLPEGAIRAVFTATITLSELQTVLDDAHLKITSGPTEAGVYSLSPTSSEPAGWSLQRLRRQPAVRFAESIASVPAETNAR